MREVPASWTTQLLAEFLGVVSSFDDERSATRGGLERAAELLEAEAGAIVYEERVAAAVGFPDEGPVTPEMTAVMRGTASTLKIPGLGACPSVAVPLDDAEPGWLLLARQGEPFASEERSLVRGMGRVITLTLQRLRVLTEERRLREASEWQAAENTRLLIQLEQRQRLLERLAKIQRSIVGRAGREEVLEAIVDGTLELLGDEVVALRLGRPGQPAPRIVAARGMEPEVVAEASRASSGAAADAFADGRLVIVEDYQSAPGAIPVLARDGVQAAMAAPVREQGELVGSLVVGTRRPGRSYGNDEQEMLLAFAEHASIALTDARMVDDARHQALHDSLTQLPNRTLFADRLRSARAAARRSGATPAVLYLDLDGFKSVNDSLGHAGGDKLLIAVARRLRELLRPEDTLARLGGDEFAILLDDARGRSAASIAKRLIEALERSFELEGRQVFVSASVGIGTAGGDGDDLLRNADLAMYQAKARGRGRWAMFDSAMHVAAEQSLRLEADLQAALERRELVLHYQPIVGLPGGPVVGVEALVRWHHPRHGMLPPSAFVPLAEQTGLIFPLGRWVLEEACRAAGRWHAQGADLWASVNLSGMQLSQPDLVEGVADALAASGGLPAEKLTLEITETAMAEDVPDTVAKLEALRAIGVRLAIDDFGTGYSSLQYLRCFSVDVLKLPKAFVDGLAHGDDALARTIIDLGRNLDLAVVAEGIEQEAQARRLEELGCHLGQGYLFSRPIPEESIQALLPRRAVPV